MSDLYMELGAKTSPSADRDYERIFVGDRQINVTHFFAINWTEDCGAPIKFAFGYWSHDGIFSQGTVGYSDQAGFGRPKFCS